MPALSKTLPVPEGFIERHTGHCKVVVLAENQGVVSELDDVCQEEIAHIYRTLGQPLEESGTPAEIRVVPSPRDIKAVSPPDTSPPAWSLAVAYPDYSMIVIPLRNHTGSPISDLTGIATHELAHLALRQALDDRSVPRWFSEGISISLSERWSMKRRWLVWLAARRNSLLPLSDIEHYPEPHEINLAYAEAADFFNHLLDNGGWLAVRTAIRRVREGASFEDAVGYAFNKPLPSLEQEWRAKLGSRWQWIPLITGTGALWGAIVGLFFLAYAMAKKRRKKKLKDMAVEEEVIDQVVSTIEHLKKRALPSAPRAKSKERIPTKIRVDDEIHTLH